MEEKTKKSKGIRREHRRESKIIFFAGLVGAFLLAVTLVSAFVLLLFSVKQIEVVGDSRYSYSEVIEASGIKRGARLYYLNESKAEKKILMSMPYLESVTVDSYFPNRVKIEIKEFEDIYLIKHKDGFCYVNGEFEILEIIPQAPSFEEFSGIFIKLENSAEGEVGTSYVGDDANRCREVVVYLKEYGFYTYLNIVDVEGKYDISFTVGKRYKFIIGSMTDVEEKIDAAFKVCFSDGFKREENCIINAEDKKRVILRYVDDEIILAEFDFCQN